MTGAVFMGMGEPFLNYDRVLAAADLLRCPFGGAVAAQAITISTVGLVPEIDRFTGEKRRVSPGDQPGSGDRRQASPARSRGRPHAGRRGDGGRPPARRGPARPGDAGLRLHRRSQCRRVGRPALADLIGDTPVRLDLIDVTDPTGRWHPRPEEYRRFRDALRDTSPAGRPALFRRRRHRRGLRHARRHLSRCRSIASVPNTSAGTDVELGALSLGEWHRLEARGEERPGARASASW